MRYEVKLIIDEDTDFANRAEAIETVTQTLTGEDMVSELIDLIGGSGVVNGVSIKITDASHDIKDLEIVKEGII